MTAIMLDSDQPSVLVLPARAGTRVATYADLLTPQIAAVLAGRLVVIDRGRGDPLNLATVADIEPGLLTVEQGAAKIRAWNAAHRPFPTAYHDRNDWAAVDAALTGVPHYSWVATLDGTLLPGGRRPAVVQFAGEDKLGFHADASIVWDDDWNPPRPALTSVQRMALAAASDTLSYLLD